MRTTCISHPFAFPPLLHYLRMFVCQPVNGPTALWLTAQNSWKCKTWRASQRKHNLNCDSVSGSVSACRHVHTSVCLCLYLSRCWCWLWHCIFYRLQTTKVGNNNALRTLVEPTRTSLHISIKLCFVWTIQVYVHMYTYIDLFIVINIFIAAVFFAACFPLCCCFFCSILHFCAAPTSIWLINRKLLCHALFVGACVCVCGTSLCLFLLLC